MEILVFLIPLAVILTGAAIWAFFWSVNTGQYDDLDSHEHSILYDDDDDLIPEEAKQDKK